MSAHDSNDILTLVEICRAVDRPAEHIVEFVEYGVIEPSKGRTPQNWEFSLTSLERVRIATRWQQEFSQLEHLALALDLLEEVKTLRNQVRFLQRTNLTQEEN